MVRSEGGPRRGMHRGDDEQITMLREPPMMRLESWKNRDGGKGERRKMESLSHHGHGR